MTQATENGNVKQVETEVKKYINEWLYTHGYITEKMYEAVRRLLLHI